MRKLLLVALALLWPLAATASYDDDGSLARAAQYTGGCTSTGSFGGHVVPRCDADGTFTFDVPLKAAAGAAPSIACQFDYINAAGGAGNVCSRCSYAVFTVGTDTTTVTYTASAETISTDTTGVCAVAGEQCVGAADSTGAIPKDLATGIACAADGCDDRMLRVKVEHLETGCTTPAGGNVDYTKYKLVVQ